MRISDWSSDVCSSDLVEESNRTATKVSVRVDGGRVYEPALSQYPGFGSLIPTPSVKTGLREDVYLTITRLADSPGDDVTLRVIIQPMAVWLWIGGGVIAFRSEEHTSELQSLMRISYAVFCLKKKKQST